MSPVSEAAAFPDSAWTQLPPPPARLKSVLSHVFLETRSSQTWGGGESKLEQSELHLDVYIDNISFRKYRKRRQ